MKKYRVVVSYAGAIGLEILADNEEQAQEYAEREVENMNDRDFLINLEPQHIETQVEEIENEE